MQEEVTRGKCSWLFVVLLVTLCSIGGLAACERSETLAEKKENQKMSDYDPYNEGLSSFVVDGGSVR